MASELAVWPEARRPRRAANILSAGRSGASVPLHARRARARARGARTVLQPIGDLSRAAAPSPSDQDWKDAAHSLKGSATAIGAWRTADAAQRAEALSGDTLIEARDFRLREIEISLREAETYIGALLKDR